MYFRSWFARFEGVRWRRPDPWLYLPAAALLALGLLMVLNTTYFLGQAKTGDAFHFFKAHLGHIAAGLLACIVLSQFSLAALKRMVIPLALVSCALLVATWIPGLGVMRGGARRWVRLGPILAEPSELVKLAIVFFLADFLSRREERMRDAKAGPLAALVIVAPLILLLLKQPDFGSTVMVVLLVFAMLFAAGARPLHLGVAGGVALTGLAIQAVAKPYRMRRFAAFVDPWRSARGAGFQLIQSFIALGEGGKWGQGLGAGRQKMFYLPQAHTDFVFAIITDDFGLIGALLVIALFVMILVRGMRIAHEEPDPFASLLAAGLTSLLALQALINIAVVIGLVPTKGLPLPFLSYGGTAIVMALAELGTLLALSRRPAIAP
ncbi:MAG TPA: putative lipid II flippase FtsW [Candidatus Binataceae bacterium]|nr:putative lipid II flippase FtsW [Candidatus Binataceae bacterium]